MQSLRHILVPRDFSPPSEAALRLALRLAERADATVHLLHVDVLGDDPYGSPSDPAGPADRLRERLKTLFEHDREEGLPYEPESLRVEHALVRARAAGPAIAERAAEIGADLVVMGRHGRRGIGRAVLGSVAEHATREAGCPVVTVPETMPEAPAAHAVLCATDLSDGASGAIALAAGLAEATGARLHLVHAAHDADLARGRLRAAAEAAVGETAASDVEIHVAEGDAASGVLEAAQRVSPLLVVVGPRTRAGVARLLGSVTEKVVREAQAPVLVARRESLAA